MTVPTFLIKLLLPRRKPGREAGMLRNTRENMSIPGNVFDCQHARRNPDELHNDSRNFATPSAILKAEGIEKSEIEEPLQTIPSPCFPVRAREKSLDDRNCLMSMTNHAAGIGTCTQSGMAIPSHLSSEMHLQKLPDQTEFQSWVVKFRAEVCAKADIAVDQESRAHNAVDQVSALPKEDPRRRAESPKRQPISQRESDWKFDLRYNRAWSRDKWKKGMSLTPSGRLETVPSGRQLGTVQEETLVVFYTRRPQETVRRTWQEVEDARKSSPRASILFSTESEGTA